MTAEPAAAPDPARMSAFQGVSLTRVGRAGELGRAVCAFLLVFGMSWLASAEDAKPVTAILLVARADLPDPNFKDAVVLVLNNIAPVPAGLIVNRPTRITVSSLCPELDRLA